MPLWTAIIVRLIFKKSDKKTLASLTALPFFALLISRPELWPDFDWGDHNIILKIMMMIMVLFTMFLVNFGIPFLMTKGGVGIGDRIIKRKSEPIK